MDGGVMANKMFFIKVPEDITESEVEELKRGLSALADSIEKKGTRWGFAIIPSNYDPMAHGEIQTFLHELLGVVKEQLGAERILEIVERMITEPET
jgi:hypothetical protein